MISVNKSNSDKLLENTIYLYQCGNAHIDIRYNIHEMRIHKRETSLQINQCSEINLNSFR